MPFLITAEDHDMGHCIYDYFDTSAFPSRVCFGGAGIRADRFHTANTAAVHLLASLATTVLLIEV